MRENIACKESPDPGQLLLHCCPREQVGRSFHSCTRISFDSSPGALWGCPSTPRCTGTLPVLCIPSLPACLPGQAGQPAWERACCLAGTTVLLCRLQRFPQAAARPHADPTCARGSARGHGRSRGSAGDAGAAGRERGHRAAGWAKPGRQRGAKPPGEALDLSLSQSVKLLAQSSLSPGWLCPLRCLLPLRAGLVPMSEPANQ